MKITKTQIRRIIKEELDATMEEGMFGEMGAKISAGIEEILMFPRNLIAAGLLVYLDTVAPRSDIDIRELANDQGAMDAFLEKLSSGGSYSGGQETGSQLAKDWTNRKMSRDEIMSKYFSSSEA